MSRALTVEPTIRWGEELVVTLEMSRNRPVHIRGIAPAGRAPLEGSSVPLVEIALGAEGRVRISPGMQHRQFAAADRLRLSSIREERVSADRARLIIEQDDPRSAIRVRSILEQRIGVPAITAWTEVENGGTTGVAIEFVSSICLTGFTEDLASERMTVSIARNAWTAECRWQTTTLAAAGVVDPGPVRDVDNVSSQGRFALTGLGGRSSNDALPMGVVSNGDAGLTWAWQIEHNGPWLWEVGDQHRDIYLVASGPTDREHHWRPVLAPGDSVRSVPVTIAAVAGGFDAVIAALTRYRRASRRRHLDHDRLPVIFNDYMNCLMGDPTSERVHALAEAAARVGAEVFVIDAGWYADDAGWWDDVGAWLPSTRRFPEGLPAVLDRIRSLGMVPGLWLEPEVVGMRSPLAWSLPEDAFFCRDGARIVENGRYHLDFRHPAVVAHLDAVVDRLVTEYGVGYLKLDYNIDVGPGSDVGRVSLGEGMLGHQRAYLAWLDAILDRHDGLTLENCSSGGMRTDWAQLSRLSLHSTSDQRDWRLYPPIAVAIGTAVPPEQAAVWAYPQTEFSDAEIDFTLVSALLSRIHLSGRIDLMSDRQLERVERAITAYKGYRHDLGRALVRWPLGLPGWYDEIMAIALETGARTLLGVWKRSGDATEVRVPLAGLGGTGTDVRPLYPTLDIPTSWDGEVLRLHLPSGYAASILEVVSRVPHEQDDRRTTVS